MSCADNFKFIPSITVTEEIRTQLTEALYVFETNGE